MTQLEFWKNVVANTENEEVKEQAAAEVEKIEAMNEKRRQKQEQKRAAEQPLYDALVAALTDEFQSASDLFAQVKGISSVQKASFMLGSLVKQGLAMRGMANVPGKRSVVGYKLPE